MARTPKPTFIIELPLVVSAAQDSVMIARFEAGRSLYNAVLGDALRALDLMRQSRAWQTARALPRGEARSAAHQARSAAFKACNKHFGFTESSASRRSAG